MHKNDLIFVAGHNGMVGSAIVRQLRDQGYSRILTAERAQLDLTNKTLVDLFFDENKPQYVFLAAAKVGGIMANSRYPVEFLCDNLSIQQNIIAAAHQNKVERLLFLGSSCIYPKFATQPITESALLSGSLEKTNRAYALAKIAGIEMCAAYNQQYQTRYLAAMPTNLYGINDNYHLENSHVLPAIIRKCHEAKVQEKEAITLWGTGTACREFLYADDLANACLFLMNLSDALYEKLLIQETGFPIVNIGFGEDISIKALAELVKSVVGFEGDILWDDSKPDGTPRKWLNSNKIQQLGWSASMSLKEGIVKSYENFLQIQEKVLQV